MNMNIAWVAWFVSLMVLFAALETYAIYTGRETLSEFVRSLSAAWPVLPYVLGMTTGGLAVHFWWTMKG